ncbi:uncharacterized protein LOC128862920 [Anastrepha ludens]|uniref:uncharacterized protein LOC128862920 n=1 Tax=Anastrepha ludens TaxID=28586 RepID=UPI0023AEB6B3|nr:uncharacterized protein LOC128862920 [Anastrepha ludens]XP_053957723.1 uncharacterized protein LOC128862920 [Anastrepha ludens]
MWQWELVQSNLGVSGDVVEHPMACFIYEYAFQPMIPATSNVNLLNLLGGNASEQGGTMGPSDNYRRYEVHSKDRNLLPIYGVELLMSYRDHRNPLKKNGVSEEGRYQQ